MQRYLTHLSALAALTCGAASAQSAIRTWYGTTGDEMGQSVAGIGDINGDGYDETLVGMPYDDTLGYHTGRVVIYSGQNGLALYSFYGTSAGDEFGWSVAGTGDVTGDGIPDLVVGARSGVNGAAVHVGYARIFSGANGAIVRTHYGASNGDLFGTSVAGGVDLNNDGRKDVVVGAPGEDGNGVDAGAMYAFSGFNGAQLKHLVGSTAGDQFGTCVANVGDVTNDGRIDFAATSPEYASGKGRAYFYDGVAGNYMFQLTGAATGERFGYSVSGGFDADEDGYGDIVVGAPRVDIGGNDSGRADLYSGRTGGLFTSYYGAFANDRFGWSVAVLGDINNDGHRDVCVGTQPASSESGYASVIDGVNGNLIFVVHGNQTLQGFGCSVADAGDVDNDGRADLVVGALYTDNAGQLENGMAQVFSGDWAPPAIYCTAKMNSAGCMPSIGSIGTASATSLNAFTITAGNLINQNVGILIYGMEAQALPFEGGTLCVAHPTRTPLQSSGGLPGGVNCTGTMSFDFNALTRSHTDQRLTAGRTVYAQYWSRDGASSFGVNLTNAISFAIAP